MLEGNRIPLVTKDGSHTIAIPEKKVTYHSIYGAVAESQHVYINAGFYHFWSRPGNECNLFEMGFGTGLNALLTMMEAEKQKRTVNYTSIELFPLEKEEALLLNYCELLDPGMKSMFEKLHDAAWGVETTISSYFKLKKIKQDIRDLQNENSFDLIYYDAFAPSAQPELWNKQVFDRIYEAMRFGGILVTYCSKSDVRRNLQASGYAIEKLQGPPGKREMLRAYKY